MTCIQFAQVIPALLLLGLSSDDARADGGVIRLREAQGPFVITIFTASEPVRDRLVDVSVMVQGRDSGDAVLDATVDLMLTAPPSSVVESVDHICSQPGAVPLSRTSESGITQFSIPATRKQASNKLLYAAPIKFDTAGNWRLQAYIERGSDHVKIGCSIPVGSPPRQLTSLFPYLLLPPLMVALFAINQCLRKQSLEKRR